LSFGYDCVALNSVVGNTNTASVCGNGRIEAGEECDGSSHCTAQCLLKVMNLIRLILDHRPLSGDKGFGQRLDLYSAWITSFSPAGRGPLGEARLLVAIF
jgi:hypothetical protein